MPRRRLGLLLLRARGSRALDELAVRLVGRLSHLLLRPVHLCSGRVVVDRLQLPVAMAVRADPLVASRHALLRGLPLRLLQFVDLRVDGLDTLPGDLVI